MQKCLRLCDAGGLCIGLHSFGGFHYSLQFEALYDFVFLTDIVWIFVRLLKEPENFLQCLSWSPLHRGTGELVGESWVYLSQFITPGITTLKKIFPLDGEEEN